MRIARLELLLASLRRLRWVVLAVVAVGIAVSVAINVLHAQDSVVARLLSAWPPLALFGAIELISRIPTSGRMLSAGRIIGALIVGGVGLAVSYSHMYGEVGKYEGNWQAIIWPASVDGLMIVAGLSLIEVVRKIRTIEGEIAEIREAAEQAEQPKPAETAVEPSTAVTVPQPRKRAPKAASVDPGAQDGAPRPRRPRAPRRSPMTTARGPELVLPDVPVEVGSTP